MLRRVCILATSLVVVIQKHNMPNFNTLPLKSTNAHDDALLFSDQAGEEVNNAEKQWVETTHRPKPQFANMYLQNREKLLRRTGRHENQEKVRVPKSWMAGQITGAVDPTGYCDRNCDWKLCQWR